MTDVASVCSIGLTVSVCRVSRANEEMLDIMRRRASVCAYVEACILLDSALVRAQESTLSGS